MDSTSFDLPPPLPPTTVPFTLEHDYNHHHHHHLPPAVITHPPYAEMIYKAIEALKEKDGSSKRAIGKYIEQVYNNLLPPQHNNLLTQHLNHLKSAGLLIMNKKSYKLPSSLPPPPTVPRSDNSQSHIPFTPFTQRGRGRPPKPKPQQQDAQPVFVSLDQAQDIIIPVPPTNSVGPTLSVKRGRGRPPSGTTRSSSLKKLGRPPKPKSMSNGLKRRPGRPPKIQSQQNVNTFAAPAAVPFPSVGSDETPVPARSPRLRGRPKKYADAVVPAPVTKQGRPPKLAVVARRNKNPNARPVGRPKGAKGAKKFAEEDLRKKLEHFQSKVKESLDVLKPYFDRESPVTAVAAIQELEMLATLDLKAPLRDESQQLQQFPEQEQLPLQQELPPQQLPQAQMYEQQYLQMPLQPQVQQLFQPHTLAQS